MTKINVDDLKMLRANLGMGMSATKAALEEANGDVERATEILRLKGAKMNEKRVDRVTSEGLVTIANGDGSASMIQLGCETDFVAKSDAFVTLGEVIVKAVAASAAENVDEALALEVAGTTVAEHIEGHAAILGEKIELSKVVTLNSRMLVTYQHRTSKDLPPQLGVIMSYWGDDVKTAVHVAQHIAAFGPEYIHRDSVPPELVEREKALLEEMVRSEGKPMFVRKNIVEGRLKSFFERSVLVDQSFARDSKKDVGCVLAESGVSVLDFARFKIGS